MTTVTAPIPSHTLGDRIHIARDRVVDITLDAVLGDALAPGANPLDLDVSVTLTGPDAVVITVPAFYDEALGLRARVSFPHAGAWRVTVHGTEGVLLSATELEADVSSERAGRGALGTDPDFPRHFRWADQTSFFFLGYEADWLLMVDQRDEELTRVREVVDSISSAGFTAVTVNAYAHSFRQYVDEDLEADPRWVVPTIAPWPGGNDSPDYSRLDPSFFAHMDRAISLLHEAGLVTHLMVHVYNKDVNWPEPGTADDERYWRQIIARYQAFGSIIWDVAKETYHRPAEYIWTRLALFRHLDGYQRLVTAHDTNPPPRVDWGRQFVRFENELIDALTDVTADQILQDIHADAVEHHRRWAKPYINIEFGYESGIDDLPSDHPDHDQSWQEVTRRMWHIVLGGAYPNYYYRNTAWSLFIPFPEPPGYRAARVLSDFWGGIDHRRLVPLAGVARAEVPVMVRGEIGREYVAMTDTATEIEIDIRADDGELHATWLAPLTGERQQIGALTSGTHTLTPPSDWTLTVLHVN
ncbi:DUF4038 domain-containing protein [Ruania rhizosphaerae]|uniref:apiosidase-like domain-containing protein n=1 Tax=Ruania rhizosphaerae TaxID=1840413 RepID=UPI001359D7C2|nr:DUF4038 domain-containing protein [Ruania rhizosphaerae]